MTKLDNLIPPLNPGTPSEALTALLKWREDTPLYSGDDPRARHYQQNLRTLDTSIDAISRCLFQISPEREALLKSLKDLRDDIFHEFTCSLGALSNCTCGFDEKQIVINNAILALSAWVDKDKAIKDLTWIIDHCNKSRGGMDDWFELVEISSFARSALESLSSLNDSATTEFEFEDRYIVLKRSKLEKHVLEEIEHILVEENISTVDAVVIEQDWPEYSPVRQVLASRIISTAASVEST